MLVLCMCVTAEGGARQGYDCSGTAAGAHLGSHLLRRLARERFSRRELGEAAPLVPSKHGGVPGVIDRPQLDEAMELVSFDVIRIIGVQDTPERLLMVVVLGQREDE